MGVKQSDYRRGRVRKDSDSSYRKTKHRKVRDREMDARTERKQIRANRKEWV